MQCCAAGGYPGLHYAPSAETATTCPGKLMTTRPMKSPAPRRRRRPAARRGNGHACCMPCWKGSTIQRCWRPAQPDALLQAWHHPRAISSTVCWIGIRCGVKGASDTDRLQIARLVVEDTAHAHAVPQWHSAGGAHRPPARGGILAARAGLAYGSRCPIFGWSTPISPASSTWFSAMRDAITCSTGNRTGRPPADYGRATLDAIMRDHQYDLQYRIY